MNELLIYQSKLVDYAKSLGYEVNYTSSRPNAMNFNHKVIFLPQIMNMESIFTLAHELGHCVDYKNNKFNTNSYKKNKPYRLLKEFTGWVNGFVICKLHDISTKKYFRYAFKMWMTYLKRGKRNGD